MLRFRPAFIAALLAASMILADAAGSLDFESAGQFSKDFRSAVHPVTGIKATEGGNGYAKTVEITDATPWIGVLDTTPLDTSDSTQTFSGPFTLQIEVGATRPIGPLADSCSTQQPEQQLDRAI